MPVRKKRTMVRYKVKDFATRDREASTLIAMDDPVIPHQVVDLFVDGYDTVVLYDDSKRFTYKLVTKTIPA